MGDQVKIMVEALISPMHLSQETPVKTPNLLFEVGFQLNNTYLAKKGCCGVGNTGGRARVCNTLGTLT